MSAGEPGSTREGLGVVPPGVASEGPREAGVLNRIALEALADEGETPALAAEAQGHHLLGAHTGIWAAEPQLGLKVVAEVIATAVVQQQLQALEGLQVGLHAAESWSQPAAPERVSVDLGRHAGGDVRHRGAAGDGSATARANPLRHFESALEAGGPPFVQLRENVKKLLRCLVVEANFDRH
jgi:hypothetical protein